jgi:hypothetical protein
MQAPAAETNVHHRAVPVVAAIYLLALALWLGGLVVLGAIVAPTVFRIVPAPSSADAMTVVFRRFDVIAIAAGVVALVSEALFAFRGPKPKKRDLVRALSALIACAIAVTEGLWLSPAIQALHRDGAIRGSGPDGMELERLHHLAETLAKGELVLIVIVFALVVAKLARRS